MDLMLAGSRRDPGGFVVAGLSAGGAWWLNPTLRIGLRRTGRNR